MDKLNLNDRYLEMKKRELGTIILLIIIFLIGSARGQDISSRSEDLVNIARSQIGCGEWGANNKGLCVRAYMKGQEGLPWCAGFVSYCLERAGYQYHYTFRALDFAKFGESIYPTEVQSGDLVIFKRNGGGHIGIVERVNKHLFISIEGNVGAYPAYVKRVKHNFNEKNIYRFIRLDEGRND